MRISDPSNEIISFRLCGHIIKPPYTSFISGVLNSTVNIYVQAPDSYPRECRLLLILAGLLTHFCPNAFPSCKKQTVAGELSERYAEAHSSGTVRELHPIPFYFLCRMTTEKPVRNKDRKIIKNFQGFPNFVFL